MGKPFRSFTKEVSAYYIGAYIEAYKKEGQTLIADIIDHTPIDTGAAAGVTSNSVGSQRRALYPAHKAFGSDISNELGGSGWQTKVIESKTYLNITILNPQWSIYLKYLEYGINQPIPPATSHFVFKAWKRHENRRDKIRKEIARGRR